MVNHNKSTALISPTESILKEISAFSDGEKRLFLIAFLQSEQPSFLEGVNLSVHEWQMCGGENSGDMRKAVEDLFERSFKYQQLQVIDDVKRIWECESRIIPSYSTVKDFHDVTAIQFYVTPTIAKFFQENLNKVHDIKLNKSIVSECNFDFNSI